MSFSRNTSMQMCYKPEFLVDRFAILEADTSQGQEFHWGTSDHTSIQQYLSIFWGSMASFAVFPSYLPNKNSHTSVSKCDDKQS